ncbi:PTS fructose transporter subunit IIA [Actinobacteria bacterium YIM 96077]|uniref:phosphoenolpyruvate--glycerone phosphotransferase n=1 Tax=Phytoactinopolyspora halophila TaxID=1981511 RepID=A0A329R236_9ACTN|nr:dihydroxyacetone kinase phosphoryl donor subunit DhaM [Phytoactinopolyspora halophila]AYY12135.1 PTS fructose transporter subunit IIA [Actinobacteria bacterium YIM 96077]RAW18630.1 PTS fructose transporter subunit IIA [Phytoactinopolyspora halophila]
MSVGIVLVSHSPALASATVEMARTLAGPGVSIAPAGGTADGEVGTSIDVIRNAIADADAGRGVVVLMDMGSSVLTAKTLLEDLEDGEPQLRLADAPFVEGTVAAAVLASTGAELESVARSAEEAWSMRKL